MISSFFLKRPVFACALAILICFGGLLALTSLPVEQYPNIVPPQILVKTTYRGASADTVALTVASPLEQEINGVEGMIYMYSQNSSSGDMNLTIFFDIGTDINRAQIDVQNNVNTVMPRLPSEVQKEGVTVKKQTSNILLIVAMQSPTGTHDDIYISNYASINVVDELKRLPGVSDVQIIGAREYSMRIWLFPDKMAQLGITTSDIYNAIQDQNAQYALGNIGQTPLVEPTTLTLPVITQGRFKEPQEFDEMILKANPDGSMVRLKDVAKAELGAQTYDVSGQLNGVNTTLIAIYQQFGANALEVANLVKTKVAELSKSFPKGIEYTTPYDTTVYVNLSIREVFLTFYESAALVALVVFIFLQNWRATIIPVIAMLVSIIGTFAGMQFLGFSLNTLTLFGLVLAIGMVVDDAIVVIENVERNMKGTQSSPLEAASKAMEEVTGPIIATSLVLCAVFLPVGFLGGMAGQLYKQFAITISVSVLLSMVVALTLSPVMAAYLIQASAKKGALARGFNDGFDAIRTGYLKSTSYLLGHSLLGTALLCVLIAAIITLFHVLPTGFMPEEDQGYLLTIASLPENATQDRTIAVDDQMEKIAMSNPAVEDFVSLNGFSLYQGMAQTTMGSNFVVLKNWDERKAPEKSSFALLKWLSENYNTIPEAKIASFSPPPIQGIQSVGGLEFWLEDRSVGEVDHLMAVAQDLIAAAEKRPELSSVTTTLQTNSIQVYLDLDREKARTLGVPVSDVFRTLQGMLGMVYVNDFTKFGRLFKVIMQATSSYRDKVSDIGEVYVRSSTGKMIPVKSLVTVRYQKGPPMVSRFNGFLAAQMVVNPAPGYTTGQAMQAMEEIATATLPEGMATSWGGIAYQQKSTSSAGSRVMLAGLFVVFLILAALYEKWLLPTAILLAVPFGVFGALLAVWLSGMAIDAYFQIGLIALIGLAAKNAILIVEFACMKHEQEGMPIVEAALEATRLRFRAIIMTSLTMIIGVMPLVFSSGAGAASRHSIGVGMMGGMTAATFLAILFVPLFYKWVTQLVERHKR